MKFNSFTEEDEVLLKRFQSLNTKDLNEYGLQLYWMAEGMLSMRGIISRSFSDRKNSKLFSRIARIQGMEVIKTLLKLVDNYQLNYEVLKDRDMARCSKCSDSCGDDFKTQSKYKEEKNTGDRLKVILLQIYDMSSIDNLQIYEMKALINALIDEHIKEYDELND